MPRNPTILFTKPKKLAIEDREKPVPAEGQLLVKTTRSLISTGTELTIFSGEFPEGSAWDDYAVYPFDPGYSNVGRVVAVGPGVDASWVGKRVGSIRPHSMYNVVGLDEAYPVEDERVADEDATFFNLGCTVMNGVRRSGVGWGDSAVVYGTGILGQLAVRFLRLCGARPVVAVDVSDARLKMLPDEPGVIAVSPQQDDVLGTVERATRGRMADLVFEVTGNQSLIPGEFKPLRRQGRFVMLSSPRGATEFDFHDLCNAPSYTIIGTHVGSHPKHGELDMPWTIRRNVELLLELVGDSEIDVGRLITHRAPYAEAEGLYNMLLTDRSQAMGVVLEWPD